jgi:hypothetical protein
MRSIRKLGSQPASLPVLADDITEFHAARLLLLLKLCGKKGRIDSLTKMAKLDFFVRYPRFFAEACEKLGQFPAEKSLPVESAMVRYRYGPWDHRYYHVLSFLEGARLIGVTRIGKAFRLELTEQGTAAAAQFEKSGSFSDLAAQMRQVKRVLGDKSGSALKKIIYRTFSNEVTNREHGEVIEE